MSITAITFKSESGDYYMVVSAARFLGDLENDVRDKLGEEIAYSKIVISESSVFTQLILESWFQRLSDDEYNLIN